MSQLIKIHDVSFRYDVSARTLRYYEDMGLLASVRKAGSSYRMYDEAALKRLEQILILRKLNISVKDIRRIFGADGSEVLLSVLKKKVDEIDEEAALLKELREIVLDFIRQLQQMDFSKEADIKLLYARTRKVEEQLSGVSGREDPPKVTRMLEIADKLKKQPEVRVVQINPFRAVTSGAGSFETVMGEFNVWQEAHDHLVKKMIYGAPDFLWGESDGRAVWIWAVEDWVTQADVEPYRLISFEGGLYAAAMSIDGDGESYDGVCQSVRKWIENSNFEVDERPGHRTMCHMLNPSPELRAVLGYDQLDIYVPIRVSDAARNGAEETSDGK